MNDALVAAWHQHFGTAPTSPSEALSLALDASPRLLDVLVSVVPDLRNAPQPRVLSAYLLDHENEPCGGFRFRRCGRAWRLVPAAQDLVGAS